MAQQRRGERARHHHGRGRWRALVAAAAGSLVIAACGGGQKGAPTGPGGDTATPPGQGGGGGGGGSGPLVGRWLNTLILQVGGDYQRIETTWVFDNDHSCSRTVETFSVLEDRLRFSRRTCTYQANTPQLAVLYSDAQDNVYFDFHFPEFSRDAVVIDQFRFRRIF